VTKFDAEQREELSRRLASFDALTEPQQDGLRKMHAELAADPAAAELRRAAVAYESFVAMLPEGERAGLRALTPAQRAQAVRKQLPRMIGQARVELTAEERKRFQDAIEAIGKSEEAQQWIANATRFLEALGRRGGPGGPSGPGGPPGSPREWRGEPLRDRVAEEAPQRIAARLAKRPAVMLMIASQLAGERDFGGPTRQDLRAAWNMWEGQLVEALPARAQRLHASAADEREATRFVRNMLRSEALGASPLNPALDFASLPMQDQADLLLLPVADLNEELIERRARTEGGLPWMGGFGGPGGRGGPPPGLFREGGRHPGGPFGPFGRFGPPPPPRGPNRGEGPGGPPPR
jgi:hypothetical protein